MSRIRFVVLAVCAAFLLVAAAAAQEKNELGIIVGRTFIADKGVPNTNFFDNTIHSGKGLTFVVEYGRHLLGQNFWQLTGEVPFAINWDEDLNYGQNVIPESYRSFFITPSVRLNAFANDDVSPWVSVGGGFGYFKASSKLVFGGPNPGDTGAATGVFQIGGGLDVKITRTITIRGEFRDFDSGEPPLNINTGRSRQHNLYGGGGVVFRF